MNARNNKSASCLAFVLLTVLALGSSACDVTFRPQRVSVGRDGYRPQSGHGSFDSDGDGLSDSEESDYGTDPYRSDTDGDSLGDGDEVDRELTDPLSVDTDGDELRDDEEIYSWYTDPNHPDSDDDGISDGDEAFSGTDPLVFTW